MSTTANGSCFSLINPEALKIGLTVALSLILVVSLVGNSLIVLIVYKTPTLRKPIHMLIANMAMSDLLYPVFLVSFLLVEEHAGSWLIGGTNITNIVAVVVPLRSPLISRKLCLFFIVATWIVGMAVHSPYLVALKLVKYPEGLRCELLWQEAFEGNTHPNYFLACAIVFFYIPFVLLVILYSIILIKLKKQAHPGEQSASAEEQRTRRNRKVLKMATAIVVVFFVCWIPVVSNGIIHNFSAPDSLIISSCSFYRYFNVTFFMAYANCAINPIICLTLSSNYRQALKRLVSCCAADAV